MEKYNRILTKNNRAMDKIQTDADGSLNMAETFVMTNEERPGAIVARRPEFMGGVTIPDNKRF